jgi:hypothetical protein
MPLRSSSLGRSDGRRSYTPKLLPNLNRMPFTHVQKATLDAKAYAVQTAAPFIHPNLNFFNPPADSDSFTIAPSPFPNYPPVATSPGAVQRLPILAFTVPRGKFAVIRKVAIVHVGGNPPDGTGQVIWRVLRNGGGLRGLSNIMWQLGTFAAPKEMPIYCWELDTISVTVECPQFLPDGITVNPGPPGGSTTAASFDGFMYPISEATFPKDGSY